MTHTSIPKRLWSPASTLGRNGRVRNTGVKYVDSSSCCKQEKIPRDIGVTNNYRCFEAIGGNKIFKLLETVIWNLELVVMLSYP